MQTLSGSAKRRGPLSSEHGTYKTVKARFWPGLQIKPFKVPLLRSEADSRSEGAPNREDFPQPSRSDPSRDRPSLPPKLHGKYFRSPPNHMVNERAGTVRVDGSSFFQLLKFATTLRLPTPSEAPCCAAPSLHRRSDLSVCKATFGPISGSLHVPCQVLRGNFKCNVLR